MKKVITTISLLTVTGLLLASCSKNREWECECEISGERHVITTYKEKKSEAKKLCTDISNLNFIYSDCQIK